MRHGTPDEVVQILEKYIPKHCKSVLEPSVGKGALLSPFFSKKYRDLEKITAIDLDSERLDVSRKYLLEAKVNADFYSGDFLSLNFPRESFDCVIMNPPFSGKSQSFVDYHGKRVPIERAFFERCAELLQANGRIIAILPSSLIAGSAQEDFRKAALSKFTIVKVYELNRYTFPTIEGRFYLLIADKKVTRKHVVFEKPFSRKTAIIKVPKKDLLKESSRLDFSYYFAQLKLQQALERYELDWVALRDMCNVVRGSISAPASFDGVAHTDCFKSGFWQVDSVKSGDLNHKNFLENGDLMVKRVSRNCHKTFGIYEQVRKLPFSDCILRIRPAEVGGALELLFSIRVVYSSGLGKQLLLKGSGANYITVENVLSMEVPRGLALTYKAEFEEFKKFYRNKNYACAVEVENRVHSSLFLM